MGFTQSMKDQIERIRTIDPTAAEYLEGDEVKMLDGFGYDADSLNTLFVWADDRHGYHFWDRLHRMTCIQ